MFNTKDRKLWKLQLFSDDGGEGGNAGGSEGGGEGGESSGESTKDGERDASLSFNDFLKLEGNQAEFDRRVAKATKTALENARKQWELETDDKLSEAEKLARMTKEQKAEYKTQQLEKELNALKQEKAVGELTDAARKMLADEKIVVSDLLLSHIVAEDAEKTKAAVEDFVKLFNEAVKDEIKKGARQETPREGGGGAGAPEKINIAKMAKEARIIK